LTVSAKGAGEPVTGGTVTFTAPASDASTQPAVNTATIAADGKVSLPVTANDQVGGPYLVSASASGVAAPLDFSLTNLLTISTDASLSGLSLSAGALDPTFDAGELTYAAGVACSVDRLTLTAIAADPLAVLEVRINGGSYAPLTSGQPSSALALKVGANPIEVKVTAQGGSTSQTYTLTVTRAYDKYIFLLVFK
jgi:hypothetical protein